MPRMGPTVKTPLIAATRVRYWVLLFISTLALITYLDRICISRVQEDIQRAADLVQGDGVDLQRLPARLCPVRSSRRLDGRHLRGSRRLAPMRIVVWWSVFTALTGCIWSFSLSSGSVSFPGLHFHPPGPEQLRLLLLVRFLFGAGEAGPSQTSRAVMGVWFPFQERGRALGRCGCPPAWVAPSRR